MTALEPDAALLEQWLREATRFVIDAVEGTVAGRADGPIGADGLAVADSVSTPIPETPSTSLGSLLATIGRASEASLNTIGPGYLAYIPGGGLPSAAVAELVAALINRYTGLSGAAPALCRLEADVLRWLADEFGLPASAGGLLTSGGSIANLCAVVAARHAAVGDTGELARATVYASDQAHHSIDKGLRTAGLPLANVRRIATDTRLRMRADLLAEAIANDRAAGFTPVVVVSSGGTTNTGAVDPLEAIADVCAEHGVWHHCDAAYGGAFVLCDEGRARLAGISRADSITFDPHKGMFLPYGTGCLLMRDAARLRDAFHVGAPYLQDFGAHEAGRMPPSPTEHGPELSREFRGLRLWLPLQLHGAAAFRHALHEKLELAARLHHGLVDAQRQGLAIDLVDAPQLSVVSWRARPLPGEADAATDERNAAWLRRINARGRVYLSSTVLPQRNTDPVARGGFTLRACVLSFRTHQARIDACLQDIVETAPG